MSRCEIAVGSAAIVLPNILPLPGRLLARCAMRHSLQVRAANEHGTLARDDLLVLDDAHLHPARVLQARSESIPLGSLRTQRFGQRAWFPRCGNTASTTTCEVFGRMRKKTANG